MTVIIDNKDIYYLYLESIFYISNNIQRNHIKNDAILFKYNYDNGYHVLSNLWGNNILISVEELYQLKFFKLLGNDYYNNCYNKIQNTKPIHRGKIAKYLASQAYYISYGGKKKDFKLAKEIWHKNGNNIEYLYECIVNKFKNDNMKKILLSTKDKDIHEKSSRDAWNIYTYTKDGRGGDLLGKMLIKIRNELINK